VNDVNFSSLTNQEQNIYSMIAERFIMQFLPNKVIEKTEVLAENISNNEYSFKAVSNIVKEKGFSEYLKTTEPEEEQPKIDKVDYKEGDNITLSLKVVESTTKPKSLYTQGTLLADLSSVAKYITDGEVKKLMLNKDKDKKGESGGIGTPATRATILKNLFDRGFLIEENGKVVTTALGKSFLKVLPKTFTSVDMTALWSEQQDKIRSGEMAVEEFISNIDKYLQNEIEIIKNTEINVEGVVSGKKDQFKTKATGNKKDLKDSATSSKGGEENQENIKCTCGANLIKRAGKFGDFYGCLGYPTCKKTYKEKDLKELIGVK
jgi:DNA topoisomerase-3